MKPTTLGHTEDWKAIVKRLIEGAQMVEKFAPLTSDGHEPAQKSTRDRDDDRRGKYECNGHERESQEGGKGKKRSKKGLSHITCHNGNESMAVLYEARFSVRRGVRESAYLPIARAAGGGGGGGAKLFYKEITL